MFGGPKDSNHDKKVNSLYNLYTTDLIKSHRCNLRILTAAYSLMIAHLLIDVNTIHATCFLILSTRLRLLKVLTIG